MDEMKALGAYRRGYARGMGRMLPDALMPTGDDLNKFVPKWKQMSLAALEEIGRNDGMDDRVDYLDQNQDEE